MDLSFFIGFVLAVDNAAVDTNGAVVPLIFVKSELDGSVLKIPWVPIGAQQYMPVPGQQVLYYRFGDYDNRIVAYYGTNDAHIRKGDAGLNPGEAVMQSDTGLGYLKTGQDGSVALVTGDACTTLEGNDQGWQAKAPNIILETFGRCSLGLKEDGSVVLQRLDADGGVRAMVEMDLNDNVSVECKGDFRVKAANIRLDGSIFLGPDATDAVKSLKFGQLVTAGPFGTYPFDALSGAPIPPSGSVRAAG